MPRALVRRIAVEEAIQRGRIGPSRSAVTGACQSDHTADVMFRRCNLLTLPTSGRGSAPTSTSGIVSQTPRESRNVAWKCQTPRGPGSPKRCVHRLWGPHQQRQRGNARCEFEGHAQLERHTEQARGAPRGCDHGDLVVGPRENPVAQRGVPDTTATESPEIGMAATQLLPRATTAGTAQRSSGLLICRYVCLTCITGDTQWPTMTIFPRWIGAAAPCWCR